MRLKTVEIDGERFAVTDGGRPVYIHDDGKELAFDAPGTVATISRLNGEARGHRERAEKAETALKAYDGIDDARAARAALDTVKNLGEGRLVEASEIDRARSEAVRAVEDKFAPVAAERDALKGEIVTLRIGGAFDQSRFIHERLAIPADLVRARFGDHFRFEDNQVVAYDKGGRKIFSREKPGEAAGFDEALSVLVDAYPYRNAILKASGASGGGAGGGQGARTGDKRLNRQNFDQLSPAQQMAHIKAGGTVED